MKSNEFFERIVYLNPAGSNLWERVASDCAKYGISFNKIEMDDPALQVMPSQTFFTSTELAELLSFYKVIRQAALDRLERVLVLSSNFKLRTDYIAHEERAFEQLPHEWDVIYFGHTNYQPITREFKSTSIVRQVYSAQGTFAVAINNSFYPFILEYGRVPTGNLSQLLQNSSLDARIWAIIPPLFFLT